MLHISLKAVGQFVMEDIFLKNFTIYRRGGHTGHVTWTVCTYFCFLTIWRLCMKFNYNWLHAFEMFEIVILSQSCVKG